MIDPRNSLDSAIRVYPDDGSLEPAISGAVTTCEKNRWRSDERVLEELFDQHEQFVIETIDSDNRPRFRKYVTSVEEFLQILVDACEAEDPYFDSDIERLAKIVLDTASREFSAAIAADELDLAEIIRDMIENQIEDGHETPPLAILKPFLDVWGRMRFEELGLEYGFTRESVYKTLLRTALDECTRPSESTPRDDDFGRFEAILAAIERNTVVELLHHSQHDPDTDQTFLSDEISRGLDVRGKAIDRDWTQSARDAPTQSTYGKARALSNGDATVYLRLWKTAYVFAVIQYALFRVDEERFDWTRGPLKESIIQSFGDLDSGSLADLHRRHHNPSEKGGEGTRWDTIEEHLENLHRQSTGLSTDDDPIQSLLSTGLSRYSHEFYLLCRLEHASSDDRLDQRGDPLPLDEERRLQDTLDAIEKTRPLDGELTRMYANFDTRARWVRQQEFSGA